MAVVHSFLAKRALSSIKLLPWPFKVLSEEVKLYTFEQIFTSHSPLLTGEDGSLAWELALSEGLGRQSWDPSDLLKY